MNTHNFHGHGKNVAMLMLLASVVGFSGCAMLGEASLLEGAVGRSALSRLVAADAADVVLLERSGLRLAGGELVVTDAAEFRAAVEGIRIERLAFGRPQLYLRGESAPFAEVVNSRTIRLLRQGRNVPLPGELYAVRGSKVNVRIGPGTQYRAFRQVNNDQIVLLQETQPGWCKVQIGDEVGWIAAALLGALVAEDQEQRQ